MKKIVLYSLLIVSTVFLINACVSPTERIEVTYNLSIEADGPFFEGPNTLQGDIKPDLDELLKNNQLADGKLKSAKITAVTINASNEVDFELFENAVLQLAADDIPMQRVAVQNPLILKNNVVELQVAQAQDVKDFFLQPFFITVVDLGFKEEYFDDISMEMEVKFELEVSPK